MEQLQARSTPQQQHINSHSTLRTQCINSHSQPPLAVHTICSPPHLSQWPLVAVSLNKLCLTAGSGQGEVPVVRPPACVAVPPRHLVLWNTITHWRAYHRNLPLWALDLSLSHKVAVLKPGVVRKTLTVAEPLWGLSKVHKCTLQGTFPAEGQSGG